MAVVRNTDRWTVPYDEKLMQDALYQDLATRKYHPVAPNCCLFGWEADMLALTSSGYICEYEIKVTRSDFLADAKKTEKHEALRSGGVRYRYRYRDRTEVVPRKWDLEHYGDSLYCEDGIWFRRCKRPARFFYVVPDGMVGTDEVPDYAGLVTISPALQVSNWLGHVKNVKPAKLLHKEKATAKQLQTIATSMMYRYWSFRIKHEKERLQRMENAYVNR